MPASREEPAVPEPEETPPLVRQRNTTPYRVEVAETADHPAYAVLPGEEATFPALLDGWTAVDDEPEPEPEPVAEAPAKTTRKRAAAADTDEKGGESR